jgi:hypothetical protein
VGAIAAVGLAVVGPWVRTALPPVLSDSVRAIAWWSDGVAAAVERARGASCVREVAIVVAEGSDLLLSPAADGLLRALRAPCGGISVSAPREPSGSSGTAVPTAYAPASRFRDSNTETRTTRPHLLVNENVVEVNYTFSVMEGGMPKVEDFREVHRMRYLFLPEIELLASLTGFSLVEAGRWMDRASLTGDDWYGYVVLRAGATSAAL